MVRYICRYFAGARRYRCIFHGKNEQAGNNKSWFHLICIKADQRFHALTVPVDLCTVAVIHVRYIVDVSFKYKKARGTLCKISGKMKSATTVFVVAF